MKVANKQRQKNLLIIIRLVWKAITGKPIFFILFECIFIFPFSKRVNQLLGL